MLWPHVIFPSKFGSSPNSLSVVLSRSCYMSESSFNVTFLRVSLPCWHPLDLSCRLGTTDGGLLFQRHLAVGIYRSHLQLQSPISFQSSISFLLLCCAFIFVGQFPLSTTHFGKMAHGFVAGRREGSTAVPLLSVCKWTCWVTDPWWPAAHGLWKTWHGWSLVMMGFCHLLSN